MTLKIRILTQNSYLPLQVALQPQQGFGFSSWPHRCGEAFCFKTCPSNSGFTQTSISLTSERFTKRAAHRALPGMELQTYHRGSR